MSTADDRYPTMNDPPSTRAHKLRSLVREEAAGLRRDIASDDIRLHKVDTRYMLSFLEMVATELENIVDQLV